MMKSGSIKPSNLTLRILAGTTGAAVLLGGIYLSPWTYFIIFLAILILGQLEFYNLLYQQDKRPLRFWGIFIGILIYTLVFLIEKQLLHFRFYYILFAIIAIIYIAKIYQKDTEEPFANIAYTLLGIIYVSLPFALLSSIAFRNGNYEYGILTGSLIILWANDTGAYFSGKLFGKNKLMEWVSPKKTWEGSIGGALFAFAFAAVYGHYFPVLDLWKWFILAAIIIITSSYGDLVESLFKRSFALKDSGNIIPGHGGVLDRFDGLLLAAPFIVAFLKVFSL